MEYKSGFVSIIGRTNVGKSTLLNQIIGEKVAITSNRVQTTRNIIKGIITDNESQIIFIDTPGIHKPKHKLGEYMIKSANNSIIGVDVVLFVIDATDKEIGKSDKLILKKLKDFKVQVILIINKIDKLKNKDEIFKIISMYTENNEFAEVIPLSAINGEGVKLLIDKIKSLLPIGMKYFPDDMYTDQIEKVMISEIIREQALNLLEDEIPHGIAIEIINIKERENKNVYIEANIYCERESHKPIIIGKKGQMLKMIGQNSRINIESFLDKKVFLDLWVKVKKNWLDNNMMLKNFFSDYE